MQDARTTFQELPFNPSRTVSWIHIGDTHLTQRGEQNEIDLGRIVDEINEVYARGGIDFVFVPGDIADDGSAAAYEVFRTHLDRLQLPWIGIVGDHDVHERSFANFRNYIASDLYSAFSVGDYRFFRLNAFSVPRPDSFIVDVQQRTWLEGELKQCGIDGVQAVLFLHCYPSDLKQGGPELAQLLREYPVLLVDMGHTHYNEISNDGDVLYSATRSTGQIEEGPVGYSVTTIDDNVVSWHFVELGSPALVAITSPSDERLITSRTGDEEDTRFRMIRAKIWPSHEIQHAFVKIENHRVAMDRESSELWSCVIDIAEFPEGAHLLEVIATDSSAKIFSSAIRFRIGQFDAANPSEVDQENAIGEWKERGIVGTQLGPNKNGRKW